MNYNDIALDAETLGRRYDAPVIAIGARAFDRTTGKLGAKYYVEIALDSALKCGRVDGSTIAWWITQSDRAKKIFATPDEKKVSMATALVDLSHWAIGQGKDTNQQTGPVHPWGNGATADITWLEHAYTVGGHGLTIPWDFRKIRDLRTITDLAHDLAGWEQDEVKFVGVHHNAIDDATYQANVISAAYAALKTGVAAYQAAITPTTKKLASRKPAPTEDDEL